MVLTLAGLWNSGPQHWQSLWEQQRPEWKRVPHREYATPSKDEWVQELERAVAACARPPVLVAHSTSCALIGHWASGRHSPCAGAFLVAPSDTEAASYPVGPTGFSPMPVARLPFPSVVVTSTNDQYISLQRATNFAQAWGSELVVIENAGHLNTDAGYGPWPDGLARLEAFERRCYAGGS